VTTEPRNFGQLLRQYRLAAGLTQDGLAEKAGLSTRGLSDLERGLRHSPHPDTVRRLGDALALDGEKRSALAASGVTARHQRHAPEPGPNRLRESSLPTPLTSFVGREQERAALAPLLRKRRLLTLVGTGGVGKTRLALQLAHEVKDAYTDGVCFVDLAALAQPDLVAPALASSLGIAEHDGQTPAATLVQALRTRQLLLVLDNCEHLVQAYAEIVDALLRSAPRLRVLATSREPLGVEGETTWPVPPLSLARPEAAAEDQATSDAVRLFVERAQAVRPEFLLSEDNLTAVMAICRTLDGIPLALELAAARLRVLSPEEMLARLGQGLSVLAGGSRTVSERHRTLRAAVDWSYGLLSHSERELFDRLSVFAGSWTLEAVEAVCAADPIEQPDVLDLLTSLVDKSLAMVESYRGQGRYRLLGPLCQYAAERLSARGADEVARFRNRHAAFFTALARASFAPSWEASSAELHALATQKPGWLERLERDHANVRGALGWFLVNARVDDAQRLGAAFFQFWVLRGYFTEGRTWMGRILELPGGDVSQRIRILLGAGFLAFRHDDAEAARALDEEALRLAREAGDPAGIALALYRLGDGTRARGDHAAARAYLEAALDASRAAENRGLEAWSQSGLGTLAVAEGDYEAARTCLAEAIEGFRELGSQFGAAVACRRLGVAIYRLGDRAAARELLEEGLAGLRGSGDRWQVPVASSTS